MNKFGREKMWTAEVWSGIDKEVMEEAGRQKTAQKVFRAQPMPNALNVPADVFGPAGDGEQPLSIQEGITLPFMEISLEFTLTQNQIENESTLHTASTLARLATRSVALAEDLLFFQGADAELPSNVVVTNRESAGNGLLNIRRGLQPVPVDLLEDGSGYGENTFKAVSQARSRLQAAGHPGPYALILESAIYADTQAPLKNTLISTADRITPLVEGGFYSTGTLKPNTGLLVSLGGNPTIIYVSQDATTAYTQEDKQGNHSYRVFERVQSVAREPQSLVRLEFQELPKPE